jgi:hypothetical protein
MQKSRDSVFTSPDVSWSHTTEDTNPTFGICIALVLSWIAWGLMARTLFA